MPDTGESSPWDSDPNEKLAASAKKKAAAAEKKAALATEAAEKKAAAIRAAELEAAASTSNGLKVVVGVAALALVGLLAVGFLAGSGDSGQTATVDSETTDSETAPSISTDEDAVAETTEPALDEEEASPDNLGFIEADAEQVAADEAADVAAAAAAELRAAEAAVAAEEESEATQEVEEADEVVEEEEEEAVGDLPPLSELPERGAVFRPPTLFLEGPVPTQEIADQFYAAAAAVVGPDNIVNNYVVRADAPLDIDGNVTVEQAVIFQTGSAVIADDFLPTLELAVAVMGLNPQSQLVIQGHTDSVGNDASNLALSQARAESVAEYLVGRGVAADRLEAVGLGETDPVGDNATAEGRLQNRRIEFEIIDLLTPPE